MTAAEFDAFVRPHLQVLTAIAARYVGATEAADVVQEALVRSWRRSSTFDSRRGTPRPWLLAIVLDQCRRSRIRRPRLSTVSLDDLADAQTPETARRLDVELALRSLPRRQREAATLHYLADLSVQQTAALMHISEGTVKAALSAARTALRTRLEAT